MTDTTKRYDSEAVLQRMLLKLRGEQEEEARAWQAYSVAANRRERTEHLLGTRAPRKQGRRMGERTLWIWKLLDSEEGPLRAWQIHNRYVDAVGDELAGDRINTTMTLARRTDLFVKTERGLWTVRVRSKRRKTGSVVREPSE